jgi:4'-phosphopantetheinyl transferase
MGARIIVYRVTEETEREPSVQEAMTEAEWQRLRAAGARRGARRCAALGRALLRRELGQYLGCSPGRVDLARGAQGKPYLASPRAYCHFNLAHGGDRVAIAVSDAAPVGVDVEWRGRRARVDALANGYFGAAERAHFIGLSLDDRIYRFFQLWTVKEGITKALGESLWWTLAAIEVIDPYPVAAHLRLSGPAKAASPMQWCHFDLGDEHSVGFAELAADQRAPEAFQAKAGSEPVPLTTEPDLRGWHG